MSTKWKIHLTRAVEIVGGQEALAKEIGKSQQYVSFLINEAKAIKAEIAISIDRATAGQVSKAQLRPDIFEQESA